MTSNTTLSTGARLLHVANGTSTTGLIQAAGIPGVVSIWADPLYEGPVPARLSDAELTAVRMQFHRGGSDLPWSTWGGGDAAADPVNDLRAWREVIERHAAYDELILWFEHDLFDQLNLLQLLTFLRDRVPAAKLVTLVCVGEFPGRPHFKGLGELTPDELASLLETRQPVGEPQYTLAARAWDAFKAPSPEALDDLRRGDTAALPFLARAVTRFLQEYPWTNDGLSRSERRLLQLASDGGVELARVFPRMQEGEDAYYITDGSLAGLADDLSRTSPPLLAVTPTPSAGTPLGGSVALTDAGRAVLAGREDRIALCGIDRWLGGVHLTGRADVWRWDDARQRMCSSDRWLRPPGASA